MRKIIVIISGVIVSVLVIVGIFLEVTLLPFEKERSQAITLAQANRLIKTVDKFYLYQGKTKVLSLYGTNNDDVAVYIVLIPDENKAFAYYAQNLISEEQAVEISKSNNGYTVASVTFGARDDNPIWEVTLYNEKKHINYDIISALDGTLLTKIQTK